MDKEISAGSFGGFDVRVGLEFHKTIDYDRKAMRKALREGAAQVRKEARRIVSRRAISAAGDFPGLQSGALKRAIGIVSKGSKGGWIKVGVRKSKEMTAFYPAFLFYGSTKNNLARRGNFITTALAAKRESVRGQIRDALKHSLVPR
ncbi:MAG: HK97 gp10 family phage protein [Betaproteobacteria bacterium]|nr:HK97 gp10 family phage protein [Betaproteobacteria bacterium]